MADDLSNRGPQDRARISLTEEHEMVYWKKVLEVTEAQLREAGSAAGNGADAVREYLARRQ